MSWFDPKPSLDGRHLVLFDGLCGLCDRSVQWLLARDRGEVLTFAPLDSEIGREVRTRWQVPEALDSMLFVRDEGTEEEVLLSRSSAALAILEMTGGPWSLFAAFRWVPWRLRDAVYIFVAKRRVRWFGRLPACRVLSPAERRRFLD